MEQNINYNGKCKHVRQTSELQPSPVVHNPVPGVGSPPALG